MQQQLKVLLTGASGTVGSEVLKLLAPNPDVRLYVFDIQSKKSKKIFREYHSSASFISGNIANPTDIKLIPAALDVVIHLAALIPPTADRNPELTRLVNVEGTRNLLDYLKLSSPEVFIMYSSSVSVYGDRLSNPAIFVTDPLSPSDGDVYGQTKVEAESLVRKSGLKHVIFRLSAIMKNHKISPLMFHMPLKTQIEICTPEDTAQAFVNAIQHIDDLFGRVFNLGGGANSRISYENLLERSFQLFGLGKLKFPEFAFAHRNFHCGIMADGDMLEKILHFRQDTIESYFQKTKKNIAPIVKVLGFIFRPLIKIILLKTSEPYRAIKQNDAKKIRHFF